MIAGHIGSGAGFEAGSCGQIESGFGQGRDEMDRGVEGEIDRGVEGAGQEGSEEVRC